MIPRHDCDTIEVTCLTRVRDFFACGDDDFGEERWSGERHISSGIGLLRKLDSLKIIKLGQKAQFAHIIHRTKDRLVRWTSGRPYVDEQGAATLSMMPRVTPDYGAIFPWARGHVIDGSRIRRVADCAYLLLKELESEL